jgi:hypothetical protein
LPWPIGKLTWLRLSKKRRRLPRAFVSTHTIIEPDPIPAVKWMDSEREEIRQRVAKFRAHQQRLIKDRKDYAASEWERMLASRR